MSWNLMTRVPYSLNSNLFIAFFLSLSNFALVRPRGLLIEKSPRGKISEIYTRRTSVSSSFSTRSRMLLKMTSGSEMGLMSLPPMERKT